MQSKEIVDTYASAEPVEALHKRIDFCMNIHNEAVRAMRFTPNASKPDYQTDEVSTSLHRLIYHHIIICTCFNICAPNGLTFFPLVAYNALFFMIMH